MDSRGDFRSSPSAPLASFAGRVSRGNRNAAPARAAPRGSPIHPSHVKAGYSRTQRYRLFRDGCTALRVLARTVRGPEYRAGSTSAHKNGSPRKQGRVGHAIDRRPESASMRPAPVSRLTPPRRLGPRRSRRGSVTDGTIRQGLEAVALPPSARPKLGVSSGYKRFHRCALQRIFRPSLRSGESDFGYCAAACWHKSIPHFPDADNRFREIFMPERFERPAYA